MVADDRRSIHDLVELSGIAHDLRAMRAVSNGLDAVSRVHAIPSSAPLIEARLNPDLLVAGEFSLLEDQAFISLHPAAPRMGMTLLHELGHYIDVAVLGEDAVPASRELKIAALVEWSVRVNQSSHVADLRRFRQLADDARRLTAITVRLFIWELFARSYALYIAMRSGNDDLSRELEELVAVNTNQPLWLPSQWDAVDLGLSMTL